MSGFEEDPGAQWMLAWRAGDERAFERIVETYSPQVYALLTRFLGPRPNREDLVQDAFLRVIRARDRYEPTARFTTWLFRIVYNLAVNETQRGVQREPLALEGLGGSRGGGDDEAFDLGDAAAAAPSSDLEREDVVRAVRAAIALLPENQRMALILAKYEERPYAEIAEVIGSTEKAVKSLIHRARETLRVSLAPYFAEEAS
ncbi:MAG: RNA polymerase sigma factor [Planctomycetota bacterium]